MDNFDIVIDRAIEKQIEDVIKKLGAIKARLRSIHVDLEKIGASKPMDATYLQIGNTHLYVPAYLVDEIKEKIVNALLNEKKELHDQYNEIRNPFYSLGEPKNPRP